MYSKKLVFFLMFVLTSCVSHKYALPPAGGNTSWKSEPDSAIILIGLFSDKYIDDVSGKGEGTNMLASALYPQNQQSFIALHRKVGDTFQLEKIFHSSNLSNQPFYKLKDAPVLQINEPGLYYYGAVTVLGGKATFSEQKNKEMISLARRKFYYLFNQMSPVNF